MSNSIPYETLREIFRSLREPEESTSGTFLVRAAPIGPNGRVQIGKLESGAPVLLVRSDESQAFSRQGYRYLEISYGAELTLVNERGTRSEPDTFTVLKCLSNEPDLRDYFIRFVTLAIDALDFQNLGTDISTVIDTIVRLVESLGSPPRKPARGLWAELFLINFCSSPSDLAEAWHAIPQETFDFTQGEQRLEVKSTGGDRRTHHFSLNQLNPPVGVDVVICSMEVMDSVGGETVEDLIVNLRPHLSPYLNQKVWDTAVSTLGTDWIDSTFLRFDVDHAKDTLRLFDARDIPSINPSDCPVGVSNVRFMSDLTFINPLTPEDLQARGGMIEGSTPLL